MTTAIYGLIDPRNSALRYVGQTRRKPANRLSQHLRTARSDSRLHVAVWLRGILNDGLTPEMTILEEFEDQGEADAAEIFWIEYLRAIGCCLVNRSAGGAVRGGWHHTVETRERWRRTRSGKNAPRYGQQKTPAELHKISESLKATWRDRGHPQTGRKHDAATRERIKVGRAKNPPKMTEEGLRKRAQKCREAWLANPERQARFRARMSGENNHNFGKPLPSHVRAAARAASSKRWKGQKQSPEHIAKRVQSYRETMRKRRETASAA